MNETPKGTSVGGNTSNDVLIAKIGPLVRARREPKNKAKLFLKRIPTLSQRYMDLHVWATTWLYVPSFIEIRPGVSELQGSKFALSYYFGYWLLQQLVLPYKL